MSVVKPIIAALGLLIFYAIIHAIYHVLGMILCAPLDLADKSTIPLFFIGIVLILLIIHLSYYLYFDIVKWSGYSIFAVTFAAIVIIFFNSGVFSPPSHSPIPSVYINGVAPFLAVIQIIYIIASCVSTYRFRYENRKIRKPVEVKAIVNNYELPEYDKPKSKIKLNDRQKILFCFSITAILILIICSLSLGEAPYGFYTFLRIVTCISLVFFCFEKNPLWLRFIYILFMILYNPVFPIHFSDNHFRNRVDAAIVLWLFFNVLTIILIITGIIILLYRLKREAKNGIEKTR